MSEEIEYIVGLDPEGKLTACRKQKDADRKQLTRQMVISADDAASAKEEWVERNQYEH